MLCAGGVCLLRGGVSARGGLVWGCLFGGGLLWGGGHWGLEGVSAPGGCLLWGVYLVLGGVSALGGVSGPAGVPGQVLPHVDIYTPGNILPCPKLRLRAVIKPSVTRSH